PARRSRSSLRRLSPATTATCLKASRSGHPLRVELIKRFTSDQYEQALESWQWLDLAGKTPMFTSLFGDVFFSSGDGCWFLDSVVALNVAGQIHDQVRSLAPGTPIGKIELE